MTSTSPIDTPIAVTAAAATLTNAATNKNTPQLHSVASSLRSCLDGMLPDATRNDTTAFQAHLDQQKTLIQSEKNSWRFGLNYLFEALKQHKEWYARNQQFVQLRKDVKRFESHVSTLRSILSESISKLDLEAGLRVAELEGRVGAYKIMFEVTKIVTRLSRPLVRLQILKPSESSLSIYCDTFVLDIVLTPSGEGTVESASLMTVEKDVSKQYPDRDEDLFCALKELAAGESTKFTDKLIRLINRAELAIKFPSIKFEQLEEEVCNKLTVASSEQSCWTVKRVVDGIGIEFKDPLHCLPVVVEPPRKKSKLEDNETSLTISGEAPASSLDVSGAGISDDSAPNPLARGEWSASVSFIEWRSEVALHVVGNTPLVMVGEQARRLALAVTRQPAPDQATSITQEDEKLFNDFVSWVPPVPLSTTSSTTSETLTAGARSGSTTTAAAAKADGESRRPIMPQLHFVRDESMCVVSPPWAPLAMRQEFSLITKEISGGLQLHAFPIPLAHALPVTLSNVLEICGHSLFFHSVLLSVFSSRHNVFGRRIHVENEDVINVPIKVDVSAPERISLKIGRIAAIDKELLLDFNTQPNCALDLTMREFSTSSKGDMVTNVIQDDVVAKDTKELMQRLSGACHAIPLLTYFALQRVILRSDTASSALGVSSVGSSNGSFVVAGGSGPVGETGDDCNGIVALDDELSESVKVEGNDILMDEMDMF